MKHMTLSILAAAALSLGGCGGNYAAEEDTARKGGPNRETFADGESVFGDGGIEIGSLLSGEAFRKSPGEEEGLPVNRFLWQASLDTLSFMPLASTDPFSGVIATDWGASPNQPGERFKVTAYMLRPALSASSLKVAVYREVLTEEGAWVPASVDPETPRRIEDAILTRARQIRIAEVEGTSTG